jgi:hypothetical protein
MIAHEHRRAHRHRVLAREPVLALHAARRAERDARHEPHAPFEQAPRCPLAAAPVAHQPQEYAGEDAVRRREHEQNKGRQREGEEADELRGTRGQDEGQQPQKHYECDWAGGEVEEPTHGRWCCKRNRWRLHERCMRLHGTVNSCASGVRRFGSGPKNWDLARRSDVAVLFEVGAVGVQLFSRGKLRTSAVFR